MEALNLTTITRVEDPTAAIVQSATRTWTDTNGDFIPEANELGPINPPNFGSTVVSTRYADDALKNRIYNWEVSAQVQHEVAPRVSVAAGYFRRWYGNLRVQDNLNIGPESYSPYSVTAPASDAGSERESYGRINRLLVRALDNLGVRADVAPRGARPP